jgi:hypothetical protein
MRSAVQLLEEPGLDILRTDPAGRRDQGTDLATPDIPATTKLDARKSPASRPGPDRVRPEMDVGRGEDLGGLTQRDPVGSSRHRRQSTLSDERPDESEEPDDEEVSDEAEEPEEPDDEEVSDVAEEPGEPDDEEVSDEADLALESPPLAPSESPEPAAPTCLKLDPPRSFFAQPDPLKWIAGTANCLRIDPSAPHDGQKSGPGSLIP